MDVDSLKPHPQEKLSNVRCMPPILGDDCLQHSLRPLVHGCSFLRLKQDESERAGAHEVKSPQRAPEEGEIVSAAETGLSGSLLALCWQDLLDCPTRLALQARQLKPSHAGRAGQPDAVRFADGMIRFSEEKFEGPAEGARRSPRLCAGLAQQLPCIPKRTSHVAFRGIQIKIYES